MPTIVYKNSMPSIVYNEKEDVLQYTNRSTIMSTRVNEREFKKWARAHKKDKPVIRSMYNLLCNEYADCFSSKFFKFRVAVSQNNPTIF